MFSKWFICTLAICWTWLGFSQNVDTSKISANKDDVSQPFFIIKKGNSYGLGNQNKWYSHTPIGDTIIHLQQDYFAVRDSSKHFYIYNDSFKLLYPNIISFKDFDKYLFLQDSLGWKIASLDDNKNSIYFDSIKIQFPYAWLYKNGKQGIIYNKWPLNKLVTPLYNHVGPYYDGVLLINNSKLGWIGNEGLIIPVEYDHIYKEQREIMAAKNIKGTIYFSIELQRQLLTEPSDSVVFYNHFYKRIRAKRQSIYSIDSEKLIGEIDQYEIHPFSFEDESNNKSYCIVVKDSACALFKNGNILTGFDYDNVLGKNVIQTSFFRVVKNNKVGLINESGVYQLKPLYNDVVDKSNDYYIVRVGNKLGLVLKGDSVILPAKYQSISFDRLGYVYTSLNGQDFGLYRYESKIEILPCNYQEIKVSPLFVFARKGDLYDIYYNEQLKFVDMHDAQSNQNTVKGYKEGKVFIGYVRNDSWEEYSYDIPSYKIVTDKKYQNTFRPYSYTDTKYIYDYSLGKWGNYNYNKQNWQDNPLAHSGDAPDRDWLLGFYKDTIITWNGISFMSQKKLATIRDAWQAKSKYNWIDTRDIAYSTGGRFNEYLTVTPICYSLPGKGKCASNYKNATINYIFNSSSDKSILSENGRIDISSYGEITLSDYITQLSSNGNIHPLHLADYQKLLQPHQFIRISGATEHVLHRTNTNKHPISISNSFDWIDKHQLKPMVFRVGNKYGLLSDSSEYILNPEYQSIDCFSFWGTSIAKVGVRSQGYRLYNPQTKLFSKFIETVLNAKDDLLLIQVDSICKAIISIQMDTLIKTTGEVALLGDNNFSVTKNGITSVYRANTLLFTHNGNSTEKINDKHFAVHSGVINHVANDKGDTLFKSKRIVKYISLDSQFLIDDGNNRILYNKDDKKVYEFEKMHYVVNTNKDLIIKDENSVTVFEHNNAIKHQFAGKFMKGTSHYLILDLGKYKKVYAIDGNELISKAKSAKVINEDYVAYQLGKKYFLLNTSTNQLIKIKSLSVNLSREGIEYEAINETQQLIEFANEDSIYIDEYKGMYGLKSSKELLLPHTFFHIQKLKGTYLVQDRIEYKLFNLDTRKFISDISYEKMEYYKNYMMVLKNGNLFYLATNGKVVQ